MQKNQFKLTPIMKASAFVMISLTLFSFKGCMNPDDGGGPGNTPSGKFKVTIENITESKKFFLAGAFTIPEGDQAAGPATPGKVFKFSFNAPIGSKLSFATMFGQSNDLFYAPEKGIMLYNGREPISGDITDQVKLWDAGTEVNEEPGVGPYQAPRQMAPNTGPAENGVVKEIDKVMDGYNYPKVSEVLKVEVKHIAASLFEVTMTNVSTASTLMTSKGPAPAPNSPGVWVIHTEDYPLFKMGKAVPQYGLERIAEDGNPAELEMHLTKNAGYVSPFSPGVWAIHKENAKPIFTNGSADYMEGLERIAEDADPTELSAALMTKKEVKETGIFNTPVGKSAPGPIMPGEKYEFEVMASRGYRLSLASMLGQSNDIFLAAGDMGIELFGSEGTVTGDVSEKFYLWDAGTEVNEFPGAGMYQAPRQPAPNKGMTESKPIVMVKDANDGFAYPITKEIVKVTITKIK